MNTITTNTTTSGEKILLKKVNTKKNSQQDKKLFKCKVRIIKLILPPTAIGINYQNNLPIYRLRNAKYRNPMPDLIKTLIRQGIILK